MEPKAYWVGFNLVRGIGSVRLKGLLDFFGSLEVAWQAPADALAAAGLSERIIDNLQRVRAENLAERAFEYTQRKGIQILTWDEPGYPSRLRQIAPTNSGVRVKCYNLLSERGYPLVG